MFASNVSKLFLEIVQDNLEIDIVTVPPSERELLEWSISFIDDDHLEDMYAAFLLSDTKHTDQSHLKNKEREKFFRQRFRLYIDRFNLYVNPQHKLELHCRLENGQIEVKVPYAAAVVKPPSNPASN